MIISRTPYRISFFGGGTDYHPWYQEHGAELLTTTINHYCYLTCRFLPPFFQHKSKVVWSKIESVDDHNTIEHPCVKSVLDYLHIDRGVEIHYQGDLPARSGLGSSSAFTVGLLHGLYALRGEMVSKRNLACDAVHIERDMMRESVGVQDQIQTAYGGLNRIHVNANGDFSVQPMILPAARLVELQKHLLLFFTGVSRTASNIAAEQIQSIPQKQQQLHRMQTMVSEAEKILTEGKNINHFGELLDEAWCLKRSLTQSISPAFIDTIYDTAKKAGATGGKLLGAGGGGFILFFIKPELQPQLMQALSELLLVPFAFENAGSQIIYYDNQQYSQTAMTRRDFMHLHQPAALKPVPRRQQLSLVEQSEPEIIEE
jgi:D-glycero-alpha-D-manno-heptose-7-phosphate kinase